MPTPTVPNGQRYPVETTQTYTVDVYAHLTGGGVGASLVNADSALRGSGEIVSATWTSTGTYSVVFRKAWPAFLQPPQAIFVGATADFNLQISAFDPAAGTATFIFNSNTTPTDVATTTEVYLRWTVLAVNKR